MSLAPADLAKRAAAARALEMVEDGMTLGLGTGSTAGWFVRLLGERIRAPGLDVHRRRHLERAPCGWPQELGVPLRRLEDVGRIDLTVDGADEFDGKLNLIKGGGAALLQEKIVAAASERHGGHRRRQQARQPARGLSAAGRDRALRLDGDPARRSRSCSPTSDVDGSQVDGAHGQGRAAGHRRGAPHPRPAPRADRRPAGARRGAERDPGRGRARPLHRHGRARWCSATPTARREVLLRGGARAPVGEDIAELMRNQDA